MKNILLASVALLFVGSSASFAAMPVLDLDPAFSNVVPHDFLQLAKDGGDDSGGGDDHGGGSGASGGDDHGGNSGGANSGRDDDDDNGDDDGDDSADDDSNDDSPMSNSNRRKPRIPGGSGCDDAGDVAEHAECRAQ